VYWLLELFHWFKKKPLKEPLLLNERLGEILQLNNESLEMQRLFSFYFFIFFGFDCAICSSFYNKFVWACRFPTGSCFSWSRALAAQGGVLQKIRAHTCALLPGKTKVLPPKYFPRRGGSSVLRWQLEVVGSSLMGALLGDPASHVVGTWAGSNHGVIHCISIRTVWGTASFQVFTGILLIAGWVFMG